MANATQDRNPPARNTLAKSILVVEDDPDIAAYLVSLFRTNGYRADAATEGPDAVEMARARRPDLVTLDLEMPRQWGPRVYRELMDLPGGAHIPVVLVTGLGGLHLMVPNAVGTVDKPFDPDLMLGIVRRALGE